MEMISYRKVTYAVAWNTRSFYEITKKSIRTKSFHKSNLFPFLEYTTVQFTQYKLNTYMVRCILYFAQLLVITGKMETQACLRNDS